MEFWLYILLNQEVVPISKPPLLALAAFCEVSLLANVHASSYYARRIDYKIDLIISSHNASHLTNLLLITRVVTGYKPFTRCSHSKYISVMAVMGDTNIRRVHALPSSSPKGAERDAVRVVFHKFEYLGM